MNDDDEAKRDAELDKAIEAYLRALMAKGYTKEQAVEMIRRRIHEASVQHRRSQIKCISRNSI